MTESVTTAALTAELTEKYGAGTAEKLISYIDMVLDRNQYINLTAVRDRDEAMQKHLADSLSAAVLPEFRKAEKIIDVGTGAGFPGALLAIAYPEKQFTLLDSTQKRLRVIDEFAETLGIRNITTVHARAEEIQKKPEFSCAYDMCVSRAVASLDKLSGWCLPFVRKGGTFVAYKGSNYREELIQADKSLKKYKGRLDRVVMVDSGTEDISGHVLLVISKQ